jgi:uncharacterized protein (TIGR02246 family)
MTMRTLRVLTVAAVAVALYGCSQSAPVATTGTSADEKIIRDNVDKYVAAWNKADVGTMAGSVSDDYQAINPDGTHIKSRAAYQQMLEKNAAARPAGMTLTAPTGYVHWLKADVASVGGTWSMTGAPAGAPASGSWFVTFVKQGDQWKMSNGLVADYVPPPPPPPPAPEKGKGKGD